MQLDSSFLVGEEKKGGGGDLKFEYFSEILCTRQMISPAWLVSKKSRNIHGFVLTVFLFTKQQISINITLDFTLIILKGLHLRFFISNLGNLFEEELL